MTQNSKAFRLATVNTDGIHWALKRNCSISPAQMGAAMGVLSVVSLLVAGFFWFQGVVLVLPFAVLELLALSVAFVLHARHAADRESICVSSGRLVVEQEVAGQLLRSEFVGDWVRVESPARGDLVEVSGGGRSVRVGRYVRPDLRATLAWEMRQALRQA